MGKYFHNITASNYNAGEFSSPFYWEDNTKPVFVQLNHHSIEFYFETYNKSHPVKPHQSEVFLYIPLEDPHKIAFSLLNLKQSKGELRCKAGIGGYRLHYGDVINNREMLEVAGCSEGRTYYELLLCFFDDLENKNSDINRYGAHLAKSTLEKLRNCEIYELIRKKYSFYEDLKDYIDSDLHYTKKKDLRVAYNIFLDEILKGKIQKWVQGYNMGRDSWFSTPEEELDDLAKLDKKHKIDNERFEDIQKALLAKHDVLTTMKLQSSPVYIPVIANILAALLYFGVFIYWLFNKFENSFWFLCIGFIFFTVSLIIQAVQQRFRLSLFLPRIIVSIATGWFLLVASEEILKNQLNVDQKIIIIGFPLVILLLFVFIFAEIRQHSPYYVHKKSSKLLTKTFFIIIYSFNVTVSLGLLAHPLVVDGYILKSKVYEDYIFSDQKDKLNLIKNSYLDYLNKLFSIQSTNTMSFSLVQNPELKTLVDISFLDMNLITISETRSKKGTLLDLYTIAYNKKLNSIRIESMDSVFKEDFSRRQKLYNPKFNFNTCSGWNELLYFNIQCSERVKYIIRFQSPMYENNKLFSAMEESNILQNEMYKFIPIFNLDSIDIKQKEAAILKILAKNADALSNLIKFCDENIIDLSKRISNANNVNVLASYNTYINGDKFCLKIKELNNTDSIKEYGLIYNPEEIYRYKFHLPILKKDYKVFPNMLIFQTLIVLLLAIVGQLIISDKTITEAL